MTKLNIVAAWVFALSGWALMAYSTQVSNHAGASLFLLIGGVALVLLSWIEQQGWD